VVIELEQVEALRYCEEAAGLGRRVAILGDIRTVHDAREQRDRVEAKRLETAQAALLPAG